MVYQSLPMSAPATPTRDPASSKHPGGAQTNCLAPLSMAACPALHISSLAYKLTGAGTGAASGVTALELEPVCRRIYS
jgi:hypothetical protein